MAENSNKLDIHRITSGAWGDHEALILGCKKCGGLIVLIVKYEHDIKPSQGEIEEIIPAGCHTCGARLYLEAL